RWIGRAFAESLRRAALRCRVERTKICRAVHGIEESHVHRVKQVEGLGDGLNPEALGSFEGTRQAQIDGLIAVTLESIARLDADAVVVAENVAIGVETGKFGEVVGRLQSDDRSKMEIIDYRVALRRSIHGGIHNEALADAIG